jgi:hypothetical protein
MKALKGRRHIALMILNFDARWRWVVNIMHQLLHPWETAPIYTE